MSISQRRDIVVIAASAGGIEALRTLLSRLPADLPAALLIVLHIPASSGGALADILDRSGPLHAAAARRGEKLRHGRVYVAPPDHHLLVTEDGIELSRGPRQNGHRPAADPLFTSAAATGGRGVMGIVLSGTLDDGSIGSAEIERCGGLVAVQDPDEAAYPGMPTAALAATTHPRVLSLGGIAELIVQESHEATAVRPPQPPDDPGHQREMLSDAGPAAGQPPGEWSGLTCPECGGPLHYSGEVQPGRYECRVGHGWSPVSMLNGHSAAVEKALWAAALRLDERARLMQGMAESAEKRSHPLSSARFRTAAREAEEALAAIRGLLERLTTPQAAGDDF